MELNFTKLVNAFWESFPALMNLFAVLCILKVISIERKRIDKIAEHLDLDI